MGMKFYQTSYTYVGTQRIAAGSTSVLSAQTADDIETYRIVPTVDVWMNHGSSTVTAQSSVGQTTSTFHPAGVVEYFNTQDRYFAIKANSSTGLVNLTEVTQ
jgi:hypothetical protein